MVVEYQPLFCLLLELVLGERKINCVSLKISIIYELTCYMQPN